MKQLLFILLISIGTAGAQVPVDSSTAAALQNKINSWITTHSIPGVSVAVLLPGDRYWNGAAGLSHIYTNDPMNTSHLFQMASVNKMYVAAMIFQMVEQGMLSLDDSIGMYLPQMTNVPSSTTIENLLKHKSGIADITDAPGLFNQFISNPDSIWPHTQTIETFVGPPTFAQGTSFEYCNANFFLLGMVIEAVSGNTFAHELRNRFCIPYGLNETFFQPEDSVVGPATPGWTSFTTTGVYDTDASLMINDCSASIFFTAGSIIASPSDVAKFTKLLWSGQILSDTSIARMKQCTNVLFGGGCNGYGYGTMRYSFLTKTFYGHGGDLSGFTQLTLYHETDSIAVTISVNRNNARRDLMAIDLLNFLTQLPTGVRTASFDQDISVFPNPSSGKIYIRPDKPGCTTMQLDIFNSAGVLVERRSLENFHEGTWHGDFSNYADGRYTLRIKACDKVFSRDVLLMR